MTPTRATATPKATKMESCSPPPIQSSIGAKAPQLRGAQSYGIRRSGEPYDGIHPMGGSRTIRNGLDILGGRSLVRFEGRVLDSL
jgi:hypothetical protein